MSRAFSLLLTVCDFQIGTNSLSLCLAIASLDLTSSSHDASELNIAPRYLNDLVSLRVHPATVTVIGFGSSQTFIASVFLPFIFMPSSVAASCKQLTMFCNSSSVLAISTVSSAYRRLVIHLPPILNPHSYPSSALRINNSAIRLEVRRQNAPLPQSFIQRCLSNDSYLIRFVAKYAVSVGRMFSPIGRNALFCCSRFNVAILLLIS